MVKFFETIIFILFPSWQLNGTPWKSLWRTKRIEEFRSVARITYIALMIAYPLHYFFVDTPLGLTANPVWFFYRFGLTLLSLIGIVLSFSRLSVNENVQRGYFICMGLVCSYLQAMSATWYNGVPYFWGIVIAALFTIFSRFLFVSSILYCGLCLLVQWNSWITSGVNPNHLVSAYAVSIIVMMIYKSSLREEIRSFIANNERVELQAKVIETQKSMNDQIQAFLPKKIRERLTYLMVNNRMNVIQAIDEVLRVKEKNIVALFSDIRGYTLGSKNLHYLKDAAIPNMKVVTDIIETNAGIPRQIGDLVFAYFDDDNFAANIEYGFRSAAEILEMNEKLNYPLAEELKVTRYVLLDCGKTLVGNIGGVDSAREVTAMGTCVNRLSRMDLLTKESKLASILGRSAILMSAEVGKYLEKMFPALTFKTINMSELGTAIKDFPEEKSIVIFRLSDQSFDLSFPNQGSRGA